MARLKFFSAQTAFLASISSFAILAASSAQAQEAKPAEEAATGNEITVTARRFAERLQDVPITVTAVTAEQMARENIDDLGDVAEKTVGFAFETFTGPLAQPVIRGQTNLRTTSPVQNVATNINGIYIQRGYFVDQGLLDLERVEIVKGPQAALYGRNAFAGAISMITRTPKLNEISGRASGTVGFDSRYEIKGGVNIPVIPDVLAIYAAGGYSTFDGTWTNNHPLANAAGANTRGKLAGYEKTSVQLGAKLQLGPITAEAMYIHTDRDLEQTATYTVSTIGATAAINTLNASPVTFGTSTQNRLWVGLLPPTTVNAPGETRLPGLSVDPRAYGLRGPSEIYSGKLTFDPGGPVSFVYQYGHTAANIAARGGGQRDPLTGVVVGTTNFGIIFDSSGTGSQFSSDSHEGKLIFKLDDSLNGFFGVNYTKTFDIDSNASEIAPVNSLVEPDGASLFPLGSGVAVPATTPLFARNTYLRRTEKVFSAFGFVQWKPVEKLSITLEGRYTNEKQIGTDLLARDIGGLGTGFLAVTAPSKAREASFFTPRASITYKFDDDHNIYASVARGYKSGGINGVAANFRRTSTVAGAPVIDLITVGQALPAPQAGATAVSFTQLTPGTANLSVLQETYRAETNWTYEIGSKNRFLDGALTVNVAAYLTEWKNVQTNAVRLQADGTAPTSFAFIVPSLIGNVGNVQIYGLEIEGNYKVTKEVRIDFGASYNHARYKTGVFSQRFGASGNCNPSVCQTVSAPGFSFPVLPIGGNQLERTPQFEALVGLNYDTVLGNGWKAYAHTDLTYQTKQFADEANLAFIPSRTLVNASIGLTIDKVNIQIWAKNLFDKKYVSSSLFLIGTGGAGSASYVPILGEQRTAGLTVSASF